MFRPARRLEQQQGAKGFRCSVDGRADSRHWSGVSPEAIWITYAALESE
jgi:hypothetical protein